MIDNYQQALSLMEKMRLELPFTVYPDQGLLKIAEEKGDILSPNQPMDVRQVVYSVSQTHEVHLGGGSDPQGIC